MITWMASCTPVEGVASGYHQLPPHRRVVDPGDRNPHLEHWIAWLGHAADTADRILAQVGEPGGPGLAEDHDAEDVEGGHRDRDVCRDHASQRVVLDGVEAAQHVSCLDCVVGDVVKCLQWSFRERCVFLTATSLLLLTRTRRAAFAHSTIRLRCARSSLDLVLKTRPPMSGWIVSPVSSSSTRRRASARPMRPVAVSLRPGPAQARNEPI